MQESLLSQGTDLMLFGMGTVFLFLAVLVLVTTAMSTIVNKFFPEPATPVAVMKNPGQQTQPKQAVDPKVLKVAQAAINEHRKKHQL